MKIFNRICFGIAVAIGTLFAFTLIYQAAYAETWCGLTVEPENRCSPYDKRGDYHHNATLDAKYVEAQGWIVDDNGRVSHPDKEHLCYPSPYEPGSRLCYLGDMDIEHIVATSEGHDSGLCAQGKDARRAFANDLDVNITVAGATVNRRLKSDRDPAEWMPNKRPRRYAVWWIDSKRKYGLSIDEAERDALASVLDGKCPD